MTPSNVCFTSGSKFRWPNYNNQNKIIIIFTSTELARELGVLVGNGITLVFTHHEESKRGVFSSCICRGNQEQPDDIIHQGWPKSSQGI